MLILHQQTIKELENGMNSVVTKVHLTLSGAHGITRFNPDDFMAVLQASVGFASAAVSNPLDFITIGIGLAGQFINKGCLGPLEDMLDSLEKWLTFGAHYQELSDSSDLNFDLVDVESVPEVMKVSCYLVLRSFGAGS